MSHLSMQEVQRSALRGATWSGLSAVVTLPLGVVSGILTARLLGVEEYGVLGFFVVALALARTVAGGGIAASVTQWGAAAHTTRSDDVLRLLLRRFAGYQLLVEAPLILAGALVVVGPYSIPAAVAVGLTTAVSVWWGGAMTALVITHRNATQAKVVLVASILVQLLVLGVLLLAPSALNILVARGAFEIIPGALALRALPKSLRRAALTPLPPRHWPPGFLSFAAWSWGAGVLAVVVFGRSEVVVLQHLATSIEVGLYSAGVGLARQLFVAVEALNAPLIPATAGLVEAHPASVPSATRRAIRLSSAATGLVVAVPLPALAVSLPLVLGADFAQAGPYLLVLGLAAGLRTATGVLLPLAGAVRAGRRMLGVNAVGSLVDIGLAFALIPLVGVWGAVAANSAAQVVTLLVLVRAPALQVANLGIVGLVSESRAWAFASLTAVSGYVATMSLLPDISIVARTAVVAAASGVAFLALCGATGGVLKPAEARLLTDFAPKRARKLLAIVLLPLGRP